MIAMDIRAILACGNVDSGSFSIMGFRIICSLCFMLVFGSQFSIPDHLFLCSLFCSSWLCVPAATEEPPYRFCGLWFCGSRPFVLHTMEPPDERRRSPAVARGRGGSWFRGSAAYDVRKCSVAPFSLSKIAGADLPSTVRVLSSIRIYVRAYHVSHVAYSINYAHYTH